TDRARTAADPNPALNREILRAKIEGRFCRRRNPKLVDTAKHRCRTKFCMRVIGDRAAWRPHSRWIGAVGKYRATVGTVHVQQNFCIRFDATKKRKARHGIRLPNKRQVSVPTLTNDAAAYCPPSDLLPPVDWIVTPAPCANVVLPAPPCMTSI